MHDLMSTKDLVEAWRKGSQEAAEELVLRFARIVRDFVTSKTGSHIRQDVDESQVAQDAMFAFLGWVKDKSANPIQDTRHATNVFRVMVDRLVSKISRTVNPRSTHGVDALCADQRVDNHEVAMLLDEIEFMLRKWDERDAKIVWLSLDGYSSVEIAEQLNFCRHRVRRTLNRFGDWLTNRLANYRH